MEDGFIRIIDIHTKENMADMFTKNVGKGLFEKHQEKFMIDRKKIENNNGG